MTIPEAGRKLLARLVGSLAFAIAIGLLVGCKSVSESLGLANLSTPVAIPVEPAIRAETLSEEEKPKEEEQVKEDEAPKSEEKRDAASLLAEAKTKFRWSSSQTALKEAFSLSKEALALEPENREAALAHARHALRLAEVTSGLDQPASIAKEGLKSLKDAGYSSEAADPVPAYYRASLTGLVLRAQGLGAAGKLPELEKQFKISLASPSTEEGGPLRAIGMVYLKAPAWPAGIGDLDLALENLEKAAADYSSFPYNHICLAQAKIEDGDQEGAQASLKKAEELLSSKSWGALGAAWRREMAEIQ